jgi:glutamyl-tRNA reductase
MEHGWQLRVHPAHVLGISFALTDSSSMNVIVIGLSHHTSPVELRERFAFADAKIPDVLKSLRDSGIASEAVILSTCNRVEIYAATSLEPAKAFSELKQFLKTAHAFENPLGEEIYALAEPQSLQHLFKVASGLDSMVLGETEILGQLKDAYKLAHSHKHTGVKLNKAFQRAFNVAKHIRTHTSIQRGSVSVASVAVELAEKIFSSLAEREVLVIGAGETSEKVARALLSRGAKSIIVANRSHERAQILAQEFGGRAVQFDDWTAEFEKIDIAISSTSAPHHILDRAKLEPLMKLRKNRPLLLIDIAVPRDIDPAVNFLENVYLYNIDDLQSIADDYLKQRTEEIVRCEQIIAEKVKPLLVIRTTTNLPPNPQPAFSHE